MADEEIKEKKKVGFQLLSPERLREITSKGGKAVRKETRYFNSKTAAKAGSKGGYKTAKILAAADPEVRKARARKAAETRRLKQQIIKQFRAMQLIHRLLPKEEEDDDK